jgi:ABC-type nitrate/sulfonate/bicarbonate transport system substrate-binding protein
VTPARLKGRRVALPFPGAPLDFQTRYLLERAGLDPDRDVEISYGAFTQSVPRLLAGQLDAAALPEPLATDVVRTMGLKRLFVYADAWAAASGGDRLSPQVSLFATGPWVEEHRALVAALVDAWRATSRRVGADPAAAAAAHAAALGSAADIVEEAIRNTIYEVPVFAENRARVLAYYDEVLRFLPGERARLDIGFFFVP